MDFKNLKIDLNEFDIAFLSKQTNLPAEKLKPLIELKEDIDLIIDSICAKKSYLKDQRKLSIGFYLRYLVFKFSKNLNYTIEEKTYICDCLLVQLPQIFEKVDLNFEKIDENHAQNLMILFGFFGDLLKEIPDFAYKYNLIKIEAAFRGCDQRDIALHLENWVSVFETISREDKLIFGPYRENQCKDNMVGVEELATTPVGAS